MRPGHVMVQMAGRMLAWSQLFMIVQMVLVMFVRMIVSHHYVDVIMRVLLSELQPEPDSH